MSKRCWKLSVQDLRLLKLSMLMIILMPRSGRSSSLSCISPYFGRVFQNIVAECGGRSYEDGCNHCLWLMKADKSSHCLHTANHVSCLPWRHWLEVKREEEMVDILVLEAFLDLPQDVSDAFFLLKCLMLPFFIVHNVDFRIFVEEHKFWVWKIYFLVLECSIHWSSLQHEVSAKWPELEAPMVLHRCNKGDCEVLWDSTEARRA